MTTILVTGATGTIGSRLVKALADKPDVRVRVAARNPGKADALRSANAAPVAFDWDKPETVAAAVQGADKVFLLTPPGEVQIVRARTLLDAARAAGVKHVVKLSVM